MPVTEDKRFFKVSAKWMKACGFKEEDRVFEVFKVEDGPHGRAFIEVDHPLFGNRHRWVIHTLSSRGEFVSAPAAK